jgi:hypothetical protein
VTTTEIAPLDQSALDRALRPFGESTMLPATAYTDPAVLAWERRHFFADSWPCLGRAEDLRVDGAPEDRYIATIRKVGLDLGITQESALAWGVFAPVARLGPGDLSGNYVGAQGSATLGVGVGGNVLVGGSANSIALQPLSVQGQVGVSVAAGLESLELRPGR